MFINIVTMTYPLEITERSIEHTNSILQSLKKMDLINRKLLLVFNKESFIGVLSIGDIQKAIISNISFDTPINHIMRKEFVSANSKSSKSDVLEMMKKYRIECMPVISDEGDLVSVYLWEDLFIEKDIAPAKQFNLPVVIMAGGLGSRLKPLTNVLPKPLIPIGDKTMLEEIFDRFSKHGSETFYISLNYKSELIEYYIQNLCLPYKLHFLKEKMQLGTAGSLSLLKGFLHETFFISNCDILIDQDYSEILSYHRENKNEITLVAALKHYLIPYGTIETGENGQLIELKEKPELTLKINSGMYILEPHLLYEIPDNQFFHITQLIENVRKRKGNVGVFPVSEKSWKDVGNWEELSKNIMNNQKE